MNYVAQDVQVNVVSPGFESQYIGHIQFDSDANNFYMSAENHTPLTAGIQYRVSATVKFGSPSCAITFQNSYSLASLYLRGDADGVGPNPGEWGTISGSFVAEADSTIYFDLTCDPDEEAFIDNLRVEEVSSTIYSSSSTPNGAELVSNPGFDAGLSGYTIQQTSDSSTVSISSTSGVRGSPALKFATDPGLADGLVIQSDLAVIKDKVYKISVDLMSPVSMSDSDACGMNVGVMSGVEPNSLYELGLSTLTSMSANTWTTYSGVVSAAEDARLWVLIVCDYGDEVLYIDNFSVRSVS